MYQIIITLLTILTLHWEAVYSTPSTAASQPRRHVVEIQAFQFQPNHLKVAPGDTITWINRDIVPHTVTETDGFWRSQPLAEGQSWEIVVADSMTYRYFCEFHPHMIGVLKTRRRLSG